MNLDNQVNHIEKYDQDKKSITFLGPIFFIIIIIFIVMLLILFLYRIVRRNYSILSRKNLNSMDIMNEFSKEIEYGSIETTDTFEIKGSELF